MGHPAVAMICLEQEQSQLLDPEAGDAELVVVVVHEAEVEQQGLQYPALQHHVGRGWVGPVNRINE